MELSASTSKTNIYTRPLLLSTWQTPFFVLPRHENQAAVYVPLTNQ